MAFDPDAYLATDAPTPPAGGFNPDAYLSDSPAKQVVGQTKKSKLVAQLEREVEFLKNKAPTLKARDKRAIEGQLKRKTDKLNKLNKLWSKNPYLADIVETTSPLAGAAIGFQRGLRDIPRAFGAFEEEPREKLAMDALENIQGVSGKTRVAGQAAPFLPLGVGAGAISSLPARTAAMSTLGATEGGVIAAGTGGDTKKILTGAGLGLMFGLGGEIAAPLLNKVAGKIKGDPIIDGRPSDEAVEAFAEEGIDVSNISPQQGEHALDEFGVSTTEGQRTSDFDQQKLENMLLEQSGEAGDIMRQQKLTQSREIQSTLDNMIDDPALQTEEFGNIVKKALDDRKSDMKSTRSDAYKQLAEISEGANFPIDTNRISSSLPEAGELRDFAATNPAQHKALSQLSEEFGVGFGKAVDDAKVMEALTVANAERFRKRLNKIGESDITGATARFTQPMKKALDEEFNLASTSLEKHGSESASAAAKEARNTHAALKTEFDEKSIVNQLVSNKKRSNVPQIEDSKVYQKLSSGTVSVEQFSSVVNSLSKTQGGKKSVNQIKAQMLLDVIDSGFSAKTRKVNGERVFGATAFTKRFDQLEPKLKAALSKQEYAKLKRFRDGAEDLIPPSGTIPKGSAGFFVDALESMGVWNLLDKVAPGVGVVVSQTVKDSARRAKGVSQAQKAVQPAPKRTAEAYEFISRRYPSMAAAFGIAESQKDD